MRHQLQRQRPHWRWRHLHRRHWHAHREMHPDKQHRHCQRLRDRQLWFVGQSPRRARLPYRAQHMWNDQRLRRDLHDGAACGRELYRRLQRGTIWRRGCRHLRGGKRSCHHQRAGIRQHRPWHKSRIQRRRDRYDQCRLARGQHRLCGRDERNRFAHMRGGVRRRRAGRHCRGRLLPRRSALPRPGTQQFPPAKPLPVPEPRHAPAVDGSAGVSSHCRAARGNGAVQTPASRATHARRPARQRLHSAGLQRSARKRS